MFAGAAPPRTSANSPPIRFAVSMDDRSSGTFGVNDYCRWYRTTIQLSDRRHIRTSVGLTMRVTSPTLGAFGPEFGFRTTLKAVS